MLTMTITNWSNDTFCQYFNSLEICVRYRRFSDTSILVIAALDLPVVSPDRLCYVHGCVQHTVGSFLIWLKVHKNWDDAISADDAYHIESSGTFSLKVYTFLVILDFFIDVY